MAALRGSKSGVKSGISGAGISMASAAANSRSAISVSGAQQRHHISGKITAARFNGMAAMAA